MYYYPAHYEARYEPYDYYNYYDSLKYLRPGFVTTRYYIGNPYITSYSDGRFELLRRTPVYSTLRSRSVEREITPPRFVRASSIPRQTSPPAENLRHSTRASSVPPTDSFTPSIVHYTPKLSESSSPATTFSYFSRLPEVPGKMPDQPKRIFTANPVSFGPRVYTNLSVFPTMRHSSYSLMTPIDRFRYRTVPTKSYNTYPSSSYYSYPTPTRTTSSAYRQSDLFPTRFQIDRLTSPSVERFYAGRRTQY
ncbi:uncharacterized protein LOC108674197 [Hyalella azteca]|uniref:Uncharacterized protein LOC108674197 n=1 Tax=Hyalella azteca TaxID=294128 RepID=A0A8B7NV37_HYAAZ|nr:uncharacterized protein LOC108674197 [Hyalella azteca]XP_018017610.1 uncharacterized protein LOC108674197 [Hyalella azteca]